MVTIFAGLAFVGSALVIASAEIKVSNARKRKEVNLKKLQEAIEQRKVVEEELERVKALEKQTKEEYESFRWT
jgi:hypothetical protein